MNLLSLFRMFLNQKLWRQNPVLWRLATRCAIGGLVLWLASCQASKPPETTVSSSPTPSPTVSPTSAQPPSPSASPSVSPSASFSPDPIAPPSEKSKAVSTPMTKTSVNSAAATTVPIAIYQMDDQCLKLVSKTQALPKDQTLESAVKVVLDQANTPDFTISDYQVRKSNSVATITLRVAPGSKRSFASMSTCEQMTFFSAMRETIVQRKEWGIQTVKFTDGKEEISF